MQPISPRLAADPPGWPARTNTVSLLALTAQREQTLLPPRRIRLEFLDYPGEWLLDLPLLALSFREWSRATLARLAAPELAPTATPFLSFIAGLPARAPADEALAQAGARIYRDMLQRLRVRKPIFLEASLADRERRARRCVA